MCPTMMTLFYGRSMPLWVLFLLCPSWHVVIRNIFSTANLCVSIGRRWWIFSWMYGSKRASMSRWISPVNTSLSFLLVSKELHGAIWHKWFLMHMPDLSTICCTVDHVERGFFCTIMRQQLHLIFEGQMEEYFVLWLRFNGVKLTK